VEDDDLEERIDAVVDALAASLSEADLAAGWDEETRARWYEYFVGLRAGLSRGHVPEAAPYHLARWLDFEGVHEGPLLHEIVDVQVRLFARFGDGS